jgi:hypothetical protein
MSNQAAKIVQTVNKKVPHIDLAQQLRTRKITQPVNKKVPHIDLAHLPKMNGIYSFSSSMAAA